VNERPPNINVALVQHLVASQFPQWADLQIKPVAQSGWDNRTFHLGDHMLIRLPSAQPYADAVDKEQTWLPKLAKNLPLPIPKPLARGEPDNQYPWPWSIYEWLDGEHASYDNIADLDQFATDVGNFLGALQRINSKDGPTGKLRGGSLERWDNQTQRAIDILGDRIDGQVATAIWTEAIRAPFTNTPVWYHGDVAPGNLLVQEGRLSAVIDFGGLGVGDPACDMTIAWTFLTASSRQKFRKALRPDDAIWARGKGWALWKGMIVMAQMIETNALETAYCAYAVEQVLSS
jgi:aminoglycoside phosphotransferase (APT) family kinase protein